MRVAVVSMDTTATRDAPAVRRTRRVAADLAARGHDVHWLCAQWWGGEIGHFEQDGIEYHAVTERPSAGRFRSTSECASSGPINRAARSRGAVISTHR